MPVSPGRTQGCSCSVRNKVQGKVLSFWYKYSFSSGFALGSQKVNPGCNGVFGSRFEFKNPFLDLWSTNGWIKAVGGFCSSLFCIEIGIYPLAILGNLGCSCSPLPWGVCARVQELQNRRNFSKFFIWSALGDCSSSLHPQKLNNPPSPPLAHPHRVFIPSNNKINLQNIHWSSLGVLTWLLLCPPGPSGWEHLQEMWGIPAEAEPAGLPGSGGQRLKVGLGIGKIHPHLGSETLRVSEPGEQRQEIVHFSFH